jgi:hypothetical protein
MTPVAAAALYAAFGGYGPLLWMLVGGSLLAALSAQRANQELASAAAALP